MKVRFEAKVTRSFSPSPRRFATRCRRSAARSLFREETSQEKRSGTRVANQLESLSFQWQVKLYMSLFDV